MLSINDIFEILSGKYYMIGKILLIAEE